MMLNKILQEQSLELPSRGHLETLQVNLGRICNMACHHCHVDAGPGAKDVMSHETADSIIRFLFRHHLKRVDLTGGAPEMAPPFRKIVTAARDLVDEIIVRCNLTILFEDGMNWLPDFYMKNHVHLVCSLPCYTRNNVDRQRGEGAFEKSINALRILNERGYGRGNDLKLDIAYNPGGAFLPGSQKSLETDYKMVLGKDYGITFDNLITITNMPINRFGSVLISAGEYEKYMSLLTRSFNPDTLGSVMCRNLISVTWDGTVFNCDFDQALGMPITDNEGTPLNIDSLELENLFGKEVCCEDHCLGCMAGEGSSCIGALV